MNTPQQTVYALPAASVSVARMQAKVRWLAEGHSKAWNQFRLRGCAAGRSAF